jgi:hypothetical protein
MARIHETVFPSTPAIELIQKIYEVDPLTCPQCRGAMRVIAFIEDEAIVNKILKHLGLWDIKRKPRPLANAPPFISDASYIPPLDDYAIDPDYPIEKWMN